MNIKVKNSLQIILFLILLLGIFRFFYSTTFKDNVSLFNSTYAERAYQNYFIEKNTDRSWGPIAILIISGVQKIVPQNYTGLLWRSGLIFSYGLTIYFLFNLISQFKLFLNKNNQHYIWSILIVFICLQSSGAIYNITNGGGEIFASLCIIGHFYYFYKKKYLMSSIFIITGIYFKFHPVYFALPYFVFALCSNHHKIYLFYIIVVGLAISLISFPIQGFIDGSLYPLSIVFYAVKNSSDTIPIWSQEIFNPLSLINKIIYGFKIEKSFSGASEIYPLTKLIILFFSLLFVITTILAGFILSRFEYKWKNNLQLRFLHLFYFQAVIGFLYLIFSVDVSIEHLLIPLISIYAPIFLFSATIHKYNDFNKNNIFYIIIYFIGLNLIGGFFPISIISNLIPYNILDNFVGDNTYQIGGYGRFIWYHFPLFGLVIIAYVFYSYSRDLFKIK